MSPVSLLTWKQHLVRVITNDERLIQRKDQANFLASDELYM